VNRLRSIVRGAAALVLAAAAALLSPAARAQDASLRIGTLNTYLKYPPGSPPAVAIPVVVAGIPWCPIEDSVLGLHPNPVAPWLMVPACELFVHPEYDEDALIAGAENLAERIKKGGYDVIALNEVWSSDLAQILVDKLIGVYPNIVHTIGETAWPWFPFSTLYDVKVHSGVMILSKLPFAEISTAYATSPYNDFEAMVYRNGALLDDADDYQKYVAFKEYDEGEGVDVFASKGVAYVRIQNPDTNRIHNVFFTHMQATDACAECTTWPGKDVREQQLLDFKAMLEAGQDCSLPNCIVRTREDVFLMGDLNIDGDASSASNTLSLSPPAVNHMNNLGEWTRYFAPGSSWQGGFFATSLHDAWSREHPLAAVTAGAYPASKVGEWGVTSDDDRLDYIVHNTPELVTKLCNQHMTRAFDLQSGKPLRPGPHGPGGRGGFGDGLMGLSNSTVFESDHIGVTADYNKLAPQCSPLLPSIAASVYGDMQYGSKEIVATDLGNLPTGGIDYANLASMQAGTLEAPGSVQWWRVEHPGTYLIGFDDDSLDHEYRVRVFSPFDFSAPVEGSEKDYTAQVKKGRRTENVTGKKYILTSPPYYVKIYNDRHDHLATSPSGKYFFSVRRLRCTDKDGDACPLLPNATPETYAFPAGPINSAPTVDSLYFQVKAERLTIPGKQALEFVVSGYDKDLFESAIVETDVASDDLVKEGSVPLENKGGAGIGLGASGKCGATGWMGVNEYKYCNNLIEWSHGQPHTDASMAYTGDHIWRVRRKTSTSALTATMSWTTNATAFYGKETKSTFSGMNLVCASETEDGSPHDEIRLKFTVDNVDVGPWEGGNGFEVGEFEEGDVKAIDSLLAQKVKLPIVFTGAIHAWMVEYDPSDPNEELPFSVLPLSRYAFGDRSAERQIELSWGIDGGVYFTPALVSHGTRF
jgi:hypothetical protein